MVMIKLYNKVSNLVEAWCSAVEAKPVLSRPLQLYETCCFAGKADAVFLPVKERKDETLKQTQSNLCSE